MTYYAISNEKPDAGIFTKYRLTIWVETGFMTGSAYHVVKVESGDAYKNLRGGYDLDPSGYYYDGQMCVHCCYNAREAAAYVASKLDLTLL